TKAVIDNGGALSASRRRAVVTSTSSSPCIGTIRRPARTAAVTARRLDGNGTTSRPRAREGLDTGIRLPLGRADRNLPAMCTSRALATSSRSWRRIQLPAHFRKERAARGLTCCRLIDRGERSFAWVV